MAPHSAEFVLHLGAHKTGTTYIQETLSDNRPSLRSTASMVADVVRWVSGGDTIHWMPNSGNAGDALIAAGTVHYFGRQQINYQVVEDASRLLKKSSVLSDDVGHLSRVLCGDRHRRSAGGRQGP